MNYPTEINYNSDFTLDFYHEEVEKYKLTIKKLNPEKELVFEEVRNSINLDFTNQSIKYIGNYLTYSILENEKVIGHFEGFRNNEKNYLTLFCV